MNFYAARQPILDKSKKLFAYELLFRDGINNVFPDIDGDEATSKMVEASQFNMGISEFTGNKPAFINFTLETLSQGYPEMLTPDEVVVEILETIKPGKKLLSICKDLHNKGWLHQDIKPEKYPVLDKLTKYAINYFKDKVEPNKKYKTPNEIEKNALLNLAKKLELVEQDSKPEDIQTIVYSTGKENGYENKLREWFILIYEVLFGSEDGPRMGFFISFFGVKETIKLINEKIKRN